MNFVCVNSTPLHRAVMSRNAPVFNCLLRHNHLDLELRNTERHTVLGLTLQSRSRDDPLDDDSFAAKLLKRGSSADAIDNKTGGLSLKACSHVHKNCWRQSTVRWWHGRLMHLRA